MPLIFSIIIPVYNMEQHLSRCLDSILVQNYRGLEIIVINDGSTDSSATVCDKYALNDKRIRVIHQKNSGVSAARNAGLDLATGDYISFIDPDDWVEKDMYQTLANYLINEDIDILRFNAFRKGEILNQLPFKGLYTDEVFDEEIMQPLIGSKEFGGMFILGVLWMHVYKREVIERNGIRFNTSLRRCEDRLFTLTTALYSNKMMFVDDVLYHYEVYDNSLSNKYDPKRWEQELIYLDELEKKYTKCKSSDFVEQASVRIKCEYLLRAVTSINNEFFSNNRNGFIKKYRNTTAIINNTNVRDAVKKTKKLPMGLKGKLTIDAIRYKFPLFLSVLNTIIMYKNRI